MALAQRRPDRRAEITLGVAARHDDRDERTGVVIRVDRVARNSAMNPYDDFATLSMGQHAAGSAKMKNGNHGKLGFGLKRILPEAATLPDPRFSRT